MAPTDTTVADSANRRGGVRLLEEATVVEVAAFIASGATEEEVGGDVPAGAGLPFDERPSELSDDACDGHPDDRSAAAARPEIVFSQIDPIGLALHYADFNIRSRHFRVLETFFVEVDQAGRIQAVVGTTGVLRDRRVLNVQLVVARQRPGEDPGERLRDLLAGVCRVACRFAPGVQKLRFTFVLDPSFGGALGSQVSQVLIGGYERAGLAEEARMANETGPGREAVLLAFPADGNGDAVEERPA